MALPDSLRGLLDEQAYPHHCESITLVETHISWVLLTGDYAYKLKKPVVFSFLDFGTLEKREHFCREELRCNRAFAQDLYTDVVSVCRREDGSLHIGSQGSGDPVIEWAVQMRQFDPDAQLDRLLDRGGVTIDMLADFGRELAAKHAALQHLADAQDELEERVFGPVNDNFDEIAPRLQAEHAVLLTRTRKLSDDHGEKLLPLIKERMREGYMRECHGDLHLSNLVLLGDTVTAFDCLEFNPNLRWIDTINDVAFLFMDCCERDREDLAYAFLDQYLDASGDYQGTRLLGYYAAYRSVVRAKVAALRWKQDHSEATLTRFVTHLEWAQDRLERPPGQLLLMCGLSGAGKSYMAERMVPLLPAIRLRSDVARKTLAGLQAMARTGSELGEGIYHPSRSNEVFAFLANIAGTLLAGGENVIVDATFIERARRAEFLALAEQLGVRASVIYCNAPVDVIRARIEARARGNHDPSEANLSVLDAQLAKFEAPGKNEPVIEVATGANVSDAELESLIANLAN